MITQPTVLILGAGASMPYGFPSGPQLVEQILLSASGAEWDRDFPSYGNSKFTAFGKALRNSGQLSIDAFLKYRNDLSDIGKLAIARILLPLENHNTLLANCDDHWYKYLFRQMDCPLKDFARNQIAFITYNYDRSLEHFLTTALANTHGTSPANCWDIVKQLKIIHLHGKLGEYKYGDYPSLGSGRTYVNTHLPAEITSAAKSIRIIHEGSSADPALVEARECLANASRVCFLGFGFDSVTTARLCGDGWTKNKHIFASAYGMSINEKAEVDTHIKQIQFSDAKCLQMLRDHFRLY